MKVEELENRFEYHPPNEERAQLHAKVRDELSAVAVYLDHVLPESREKAIVFTKLEETMFWANASVARNVD